MQISKFLVDELKLNIRRRLYFTDSMCVLKYISNETTGFHTFAANIIQVASEIDQWKSVNTTANPADEQMLLLQSTL